MLDNQVLNMTPGEVPTDAPIADFIQKIATSIAESQLRLDQMAVEVASILSETQVSFNTADGGTTKKSLLELGFAPTFYHFTETDIQVKMAIHFRVEESLTVGAGASIGDSGAGGDSSDDAAAAPKENRAVPYGATVNAEYQRKYDFDLSGSSEVKTKLVSVPPPTVFIEVIKEHARAGGGAIG